MPKITLTDAAVKRLKVPAIGQIDYFDSGYPGLALRVSCGGRKSWNYIYRFAGKPRRMTFDTFPVLTSSIAVLRTTHGDCSGGYLNCYHHSRPNGPNALRSRHVGSDLMRAASRI
jgi:hypothetical protein